MLMDRTERRLVMVRSLGELLPLRQYNTEYGNTLCRVSKYKARLADTIELDVTSDESVAGAVKAVSEAGVPLFGVINWLEHVVFIPLDISVLFHLQEDVGRPLMLSGQLLQLLYFPL